MTPNHMHPTRGVDAAAYTKLAEIILRFATVVEDLLNTETRVPFLDRE